MRSALAFIVGLLMALSVSGANAQAVGWVAVAADSAGSGDRYGYRPLEGRSGPPGEDRLRPGDL